ALLAGRGTQIRPQEENPFQTSPLVTPASALMPGSTRKLDASQRDKGQWIAEGKSLFKTGRYLEALEAFECAIEVDPRSASAYNFRGLALEEMGEFHEALISYEAAIAHDPNFPDAWRKRGEVLYQLKRYEEALMVYERL